MEFLSLTGGCTGSPESIHVKMPHCWKSHVTAHISYTGVAGIVIPVQCGKKKQDALDILEEFDTFMEVYLSTGEF